MGFGTLSEQSDDAFVFADEHGVEPAGPVPGAAVWKVLVADDEADIHQVTEMALAGFEFDNRALSFLHAHSAQEARDLLATHDDIAVILLDVVMESDDAGLRLVRHIREGLGNSSVRIILRTGQPGQAPEHRVVAEYDINDYKEKTELTARKLSTALHSALRAYRDIVALEANRRGLQKVIEASASIFRLQSVDRFTRGVLEQLTALLYLDPDAVYCHASGVAAVRRSEDLEIVAATGEFETLVGQSCEDCLDPDMLSVIRDLLKSRCQTLSRDNHYAAYVKTAGGAENILCIRGSRVPDAKDNELIELFCKNVSIALDNLNLQQDVRTEAWERMQAEERATELARLPDQSPNPVIRIAIDGAVLYANRASAPVISALDCGVGDRVPAEWSDLVAAALKRGEPSSAEIKCGDRIFDFRIMPVVETGYANLYGLDVTTSRQAQARVEHLAQHDALTDLPNRAQFINQLQQDLMTARRTGGKVALLQIDLDRFKDVNDICGHQVGDLLLQQVSRRIVAAARQRDSIARLGGDEFAVIMTGHSHSASAAALAQRIIDNVSEPYLLDGNTVRIGCSIGITAFPDDSVNASELQKNADLAMYQAKAAGRNSYHFYDADLHRAVQHRRVMEMDLREALESLSFEVHYQPKIALDSGRIVGAEALLRWRHPERGLVGPDEFIPVAERTGLIGPIGEWVLAESCRTIADWRSEGLAIDNIAVNLSAEQFRDTDLAGTVRSVLASTGLPPGLLELEITESVVMDDVERTIGVLGSLKELGIGLTIDDFGTGYSSLSYLRRFPVGKMKIDRSFVADILTNPDAFAIAHAVVSLGHSLNLKLVAEGIESAEQARFLADIECQEGQGFYFSQPVPAQSFKDLLTGARSIPAY